VVAHKIPAQNSSQKESTLYSGSRGKKKQLKSLDYYWRDLGFWKNNYETALKITSG